MKTKAHQHYWIHTFKLKHKEKTHFSLLILQPLQSRMNVKPVWILAVLFLASVFTESEGYFGAGPRGKRTIKLQVEHFCFHYYFWKLTWSAQLNEQPKRNLKNFKLERDRSLIFETTGIILWTVDKDFFTNAVWGKSNPIVQSPFSYLFVTLRIFWDNHNF